jgi:hypothetical protein
MIHFFHGGFKSKQILNMNFIKFSLKWIGSNLAIPFWVVGHVHLTMNVYKDIYEVFASFGMNIIVAIGFWLDWKETKEKKN